jgi:NADH:ubiquinone oxidoreductase subunit F (NADH-binding)/NADH:ubiquinone oxidoreductase subunit E/Pyruvate/2-oxoacid:ferredoxin oxidoreductase delta subunit
VDRIVAEQGRTADAVIPILRALQEHYRYVPPEALRRVCELTEIRPAAISGVATFYDLFRHRPAGRHLIGVCVGTACHVKGADAVLDAFRRRLGLSAGEDTDAARQFTLGTVSCLGCCTLAPVVQIDQTIYGHVQPAAVARVLDDFLARQRAGAGSSRATATLPGAPVGEVRLGLGSCCQARGSARVLAAVEEALGASGQPVTVRHVGCVGSCSQTPLVDVLLADGARHTYTNVAPEEAGHIIRRHFKPRGTWRSVRSRVSTWLERLYAGDEAEGGLVCHDVGVRDRPPALAEFLRAQKHIASESCGELDPLDYEDYVRGGGFVAFRRCVQGGEPEDVITQIAESGLRGRGGAGYPSGRKWQQVRAAAGQEKILVCNGDEGDPGAFMDRMLLESYPFRVLEGVMIAAWAIGAREGVLYIRTEYPLALQRVRVALARLADEGLLGETILGSVWGLRLRIVEGAGAFVCGEETALLASIEGRRGTPRLRPPYPAEAGLYGKPTLVSNVETYANVPWILRHGAAAFAAMGTAGSKGTKVFALAGKTARGGLIEVPMGISIRAVVEGIGGGVAGGRTFKAVQIGGPSGGCVPAALADTPIDYEALTAAGAIMGSGGIVVLDDSDCMVEIARYFLAFTQAQSCGRCAPCRVGTRRMLELLEKLCAGTGEKGDVEALESLAWTVKRLSLCGLGQTAPNPVLSTLRHFRHEYDAHLAGACPAARCKALITYTISERCIGCTRCAQGCPVGAIALRPFERQVIDQRLCVRCGACRATCPVDAVEVR